MSRNAAGMTGGLTRPMGSQTITFTADGRFRADGAAGAYVLRDGVLVMTDGAEQSVWYIDAAFAVYTRVAVKDSALLTPPALTFTLTYSAGPGGTIQGAANQSVGYGGDGAAVTAVPDEGYEFTGWSDGTLSATRTDTADGDKTLYATFAAAAQESLFAGGDGYYDDPYQIETISHLLNVRLYPDACYILNNDIVFDGGAPNFVPLYPYARRGADTAV